MQFMLSVLDDSPYSEIPAGTPEEQAAIDVFNTKLQAEGHWVFAGGLGSPATATVIDNRADAPLFTDGPFVETKEYIAGVWIIEASDLDVALALATEGSKACNRRLELRPLFDAPDQ